jgi:hypothetical protein
MSQNTKGIGTLRVCLVDLPFIEEISWNLWRNSKEAEEGIFPVSGTHW